MVNWSIAAKKAILRFEGLAPEAMTRNLRTACDLIDCARWLRECSMYPASVSLPDRFKVFDRIAQDVSSKVILYLEFGVWTGVSLKYWSRLLRNPRSMLHGFDSFEGLPEHWRQDHPKGRFDTSGSMPELSDERVKLFKGWFTETLSQYVMPEHDALVINIDCDLYSSTKDVLDYLKESIQIGDWLYFDEFGSWDHECRAFREFIAHTQMKFEAVAESNAFWSVAFRRTN
ncbi:MAG: TylF/MycF/NovP-related O-methyltransferase [Candidatus Binataceae bacterium]